MTHARIAVLGLGLIALAACSDEETPSSPAVKSSEPTAAVESEASAAFKRYVSIGTSVSMGYQSDGTTAASQNDSWPAQLARLAGSPMTLPSIGGTGCKAPMAAPLASGVRISGEPLSMNDSLLNCAANLPGVTLPSANVAIDGSTTFDVLYSTPQTVGTGLKSKVYSRVLPPNTSQLHAALMQNPKLVSIELGANEVLGAKSGVAVPGVSMYPISAWRPMYDALVDTVVRRAPRVVMVGLVKDAGNFPSFRRGSEIYADAPTLLAAFNVAVSSDCNGSTNLVFVPQKVVAAIATGLYFRSKGLPPFPFSCANVPGQADNVLDAAETAFVNATLKDMTTHIKALAKYRNVAYFELEALYGLPNLKAPFSSVTLMTSLQPYGPLFSLDGTHPSAAGHAILAAAAAKALNARYNLGI